MLAHQGQKADYAPVYLTCSAGVFLFGIGLNVYLETKYITCQRGFCEKELENDVIPTDLRTWWTQ